MKPAQVSMRDRFVIEQVQAESVSFAGKGLPEFTHPSRLMLNQLPDLCPLTLRTRFATGEAAVLEHDAAPVFD